MIVQADELLELSTVLIAPTSRAAAPASFRPLIDISGTPTRVLTDQLRVLDVQAIAESIGYLTRPALEALDEALALVLGLRV